MISATLDPGQRRPRSAKGGPAAQNRISPATKNKHHGRIDTTSTPLCWKVRRVITMRNYADEICKEICDTDKFNKLVSVNGITVPDLDMTVYVYDNTGRFSSALMIISREKRDKWRDRDQRKIQKLLCLIVTVLTFAYRAHYLFHNGQPL